MATYSSRLSGARCGAGSVSIERVIPTLEESPAMASRTVMLVFICSLALAAACSAAPTGGGIGPVTAVHPEREHRVLTRNRQPAVVDRVASEVEHARQRASKDCVIHHAQPCGGSSAVVMDRARERIVRACVVHRQPNCGLVADRP